MSAQSEARENLKTLLEGALPGMLVFSSAPQKVVPPFIGIGPWDPYIDFNGVPFGGRRVHLGVTVVAGAGTNDMLADELDDLIDSVILAIDEDQSGEFVPIQVDRPGQVGINGQSHLGCVIEVTKEI